MDICKLEFNGKVIPVSYNEDRIKSSIEECDYMLRKAADYINKKELDSKTRDIIMADEVIYSSYIEGYELTYRRTEWLTTAKYGGTKVEKANICGYLAYKDIIGNKVPENKEETRDAWRKLIRYKPYLRNFRTIGVRVGSRAGTVHIAPKAKYVKSLMNVLFEQALKNVSYNAVVKALTFHYIFAFIHPFLDGNGRMARLMEQAIILDAYKLNACIQISGAILNDKRSYYNSFKSGQTFGEDHLDVLSIDISEFININCKFISAGIQKLMIECEYSNNLEIPLCKAENKFKAYSRDEAISMCDNLEHFCELIIAGKISIRDFGYIFNENPITKIWF